MIATSMEQEIVIDALLGIAAGSGDDRFMVGVGCGLLVAVGLLDLDIADQDAEAAMHHGEEILAAVLERRKQRR